MPGGLRVLAEGRSGLCVLRVAGELDFLAAEDFGDRVDEAVHTVPGPVVLDLAGLTFIDARGARALVAVIRTLPGGRVCVVRNCRLDVRLILDLLSMSLNYQPADYLTTEEWIAPGSWTCELVSRVQDARLHAMVATQRAAGVLATVANTSIRLASLRERTGLIREQGRLTLASSRAARGDATRGQPETAL